MPDAEKNRRFRQPYPLTRVAEPNELPPPLWEEKGLIRACVLRAP
jgi:hypothetical protein